MSKRKGLLKQGEQRITPVDGARLYASLREEVTKAGILNRDYRYYAFLSLFIFGGYACSLYNIFKADTPALIIVCGLAFAFFSVQIAGLIHDAGHRSIFQSVRNNDLTGNMFSFFVGHGYSFWRGKHNKHHAHTNQEGEDPDVELPLLSFTTERVKRKKGLAKLLIRYQAYMYYPMGIFVVFSPRLGAIKYLIQHFKIKILWEALLFIAGFAAYFILPFFLFDLSKALLLFAVVNFSAGAYLINVFAPNHKGMPQIDEGVKFSFLEQQIITSRNIHGHWLTDFLYMGLNYQIEHHLFPNTPRNKLKLITPFVKKVCRQLNFEYTQVSFVESNKIIVSELNTVGKTLAAARAS